ncbi:hypothetical protein FQN54_003206 [Arachnomyces sp. PD_36]|nr:hypothetical protein FQN54_003206 [Arachnomyces sp. PD_36]
MTHKTHNQPSSELHDPRQTATGVKYQYTALPDSRIRLLALLPGRFDDPLCGEIIETDFSPDGDIDPPYEALSYVWGDQSNPQPIYIVQADSSLGGLIALGPNLYSALRQLRFKNSRRIIWCDLISINQADLIERAKEISRMADIYRKARRAVVWLGTEADDSALAMRALEYAGSKVQVEPTHRCWKPKPHAHPRFSWESQGNPYSQRELQAIQKLVARSWFKRLWVRQEITAARSSIVVVGDQEVSWVHFISAAAFLDSLIRLGGSTDTYFGRNLFNIFEFGCMGSYKDIMNVLHACRACECTENHDRVYAILGLLSSERTLNIQPDYSKGHKSVYQDLVMQYYHRHRRLNILLLCETAETPSWVPDLHNLPLNTGVDTRVAQYCWASGEAAASLTLSNDTTIEIYGVKCGTLGKNISPPIDKDSDARVLKRAIIQILRDYMGDDASRWDNTRFEILAKGLLGCLWYERTGRRNHSSLSFALVELRRWGLEQSDCFADDSPDDRDSLTLINHISRVLFHGDSCCWTQDGHLGLGFKACREGDDLYAILGCRRLIALRKEPTSDKHRIVGKFDHPGYNDGEAFLGKLPADWVVNYKHLLLASNRPKFVHKDGTSQWQDPRLKDVRLPRGWHEGQDQDGYPYWFRSGMSNERSYSDPRLTYDELKKRGIKIERLVIV